VQGLLFQGVPLRAVSTPWWENVLYFVAIVAALVLFAVVVNTLLKQVRRFANRSVKPS